MITFVTGDIFSSPAQVLTNPVNVVGVMGNGLAAEFKARFAEMFADYSQRCEKGEVQPGRPYLWENEHAQILNFPTKRHWRDPSLLDDIELGLQYLVAHYQDMGIHSIAIPALGTGLGGLKWTDVRLLIEKHLSNIADLEVFVYEPTVAMVKDDPSSPNISATESVSSDFAAQGI